MGWGRTRAHPFRMRPSHHTEGRVIYAVGDVHGRHDLLRQLIRLILCDSLELGCAERPALILLGDLIDRGPATREVIELVLQVRDAGVFELRSLKGNHEDALLAFLSDAEMGRAWARHGGADTLRSYGVSAPAEDASLRQWDRTRAAFLQALPPSHLNFLRNLELVVSAGSYTFVHAGLRPGVALGRQSAQDLMWIRESFLRAPPRQDTVVVHGHSAVELPVLEPGRLGLDTGAYASGVLTAVRLFGPDQKLLQARSTPPGEGGRRGA